jgi:cellulose synthase/poly-beta-1,6-N-acetylglucosamine synthase-like glycosyltransferase
MLTIFVKVVFLLFFLFLALSVLYLFVLALWGRCFPKKDVSIPAAAPQKRIAVLVPAYKEDGIIVSTAANLLSQDYPADLFTIYMIADGFQPVTLERLRSMPLKVIEVNFEKSTKAKSLNEAFRRMDAEYDIALVCDADNMLAKDFLQQINSAFVNGARAVQGRRVAKNLDSQYAILDACSEAVNNHIFRKGNNAIGLASSVIGSGMAFDFAELRAILSSVSAVGGFDKVLQLRIVEQGIFIYYLEGAVIYDEKVGDQQAFKEQRKRWVSSQYMYLRRYSGASIRQLFRGNLDYFNLGIVSNLLPPRSFFFVLLPVLMLAGFLIGPAWGWLSLAVTVLFGLSLVMGVPPALVNRDLLRALGQLPRAVWTMFGTLLHLKKANKTFIHTVHTKTEISSSILKEEVKQG